MTDITKERYTDAEKVLKVFNNAVGQTNTKAVDLNELAETKSGLLVFCYGLKPPTFCAALSANASYSPIVNKAMFTILEETTPKLTQKEFNTIVGQFQEVSKHLSVGYASRGKGKPEEATKETKELLWSSLEKIRKRDKLAAIEHGMTREKRDNVAEKLVQARRNGKDLKGLEAIIAGNSGGHITLIREDREKGDGLTKKIIGKRFEESR